LPLRESQSISFEGPTKENKVTMQIGRNDSCHCGSGRKYKRCCYAKDREAESATLPERRPFTTEINPSLNDKCDFILEILENGETVRSGELANNLIVEFPHYYMANYVMGTWFCLTEKAEEGIPYLRKATELFPPFAEAYYNLAGAYRKQCMFKEMFECLRTVVRIDGDNGELSQKATDDIDEIKAMIKKYEGLSIEAYLENKEKFETAFQALKEERYERAIELFNQVLIVNPRNVQSYGNLALAYANIGKKSKALKCIEKAVELDPSYEPAIFNRIMIEEMVEGEPQRAAKIKEVNYYSDYRIKGKRSYAREVSLNTNEFSPRIGP
jgi:tetratricopeptide (TPR) repeat protein